MQSFKQFFESTNSPSVPVSGVFYHGTNHENLTLDGSFNAHGSGSGDTFYGAGLYVSRSQKKAASYGKNVFEVTVDIPKVFQFGIGFPINKQLQAVTGTVFYGDPSEPIDFVEDSVHVGDLEGAEAFKKILVTAGYDGAIERLKLGDELVIYNTDTITNIENYEL